MNRAIWVQRPGGERQSATLGEPIGPTGAQGAVWTVPELPGTVAKIVHRTDPVHLVARLDAMLHDPAGWTVRDGVPIVAWPVATVRRRPGEQVAGYLAPRLGAPRYAPLPHLLNPALRMRLLPGATWAWWLGYTESLARAVHAVHAAGHVIGDLAPANLFATAAGGACMVDADGWQIHDPRTGMDLPCPSSRPEYTAPEVLDRPGCLRGPATDRWALAVLVIELLCMGFHPFGGVPPGTRTPIEETDNVRAGRSWLFSSELQTPVTAPPRDVLPRVVRLLAGRAFGPGRTDPEHRPLPLDWAAALARARREVTVCSRRPSHAYPRENSACPWCAMAAAGHDPFTP